jgi:hypothetical protein
VSRFFIGEIYGRGAGLGRDLAVGAILGVGVSLGVVVGVIVGVGVALAVAVAVDDGAGLPQYLAPVLVAALKPATCPPHTIISSPLHIAE